MMPVVLAAGITLLASILLPFAVKPWLVKMGVVDVPSARSSHARTTIRGMGVAVSLATGIGYVAAILLGAVTVDRSVFLVVLAIIVASAGVGWIEDLRGLSIRGRAAAQLGIGAAGSAALLVLTGQSFWWLPLAAEPAAPIPNCAAARPRMERPRRSSIQPTTALAAMIARTTRKTDRSTVTAPRRTAAT